MASVVWAQQGPRLSFGPTCHEPRKTLTPVKVALDATALIGPRTGVGEFCARLLEQLAGRHDVEVGAFAVSRAGRGGLAGLLPAGVRVMGRPGPGLPARLLHAMWARSAFPSAELLVGGCDVVHGTNFVVPPARAATVVTVHDLSPLHFPGSSSPAARAYPDLVRAAVRRGTWVHADSAFVGQEVVDLLEAPPERVRVVHLGVGNAPGGTAPLSAEALLEVLAGLLPDWVTSYVLAMSRVEPRKDFPGLVGAFGHLAARHPGLALVLAGPDGVGSDELAQAIAASPARDRVVRLGWVNDRQRDALLQAATVFAYPSRYEGFGLPPLQAMAAGTPVVATRCGALEEILGDAARLVDVGDQDGLAEAIEQLVDDPGARRQLSGRGLARAALFTWEACADGLVALYGEAHRAHQPTGA